LFPFLFVFRVFCEGEKFTSHDYSIQQPPHYFFFLKEVFWLKTGLEAVVRGGIEFYLFLIRKQGAQRWSWGGCLKGGEGVGGGGGGHSEQASYIQH